MFKSLSALIFAVLFFYAPDAFSQDVQDIKTVRQNAEKGDLEAQNTMGYWHQRGEGVERSIEKSVFWYRKAAESGYAKSQSNMGNLYLAGKGVPKDTAEAIKWLEKAAKQDYAKAQYNLGTLYGKGNQTLKRDVVKEAEWYLKAAKNGFPKAMNNLAGMYMRGEGVPLDLKEAAKWAEKGAEEGEPMAQAMIGQFYLVGELFGLEKNRIKAHYYLSRASAAGIPAIDSFLEKALPQNKVELVAKMSDELCQKAAAGVANNAKNGSSPYLFQSAKQMFDEDNEDFQQLIQYSPKEDKTALKKRILLETVNNCPVFAIKDPILKQDMLKDLDNMVKELSKVSTSTDCDSTAFMEAVAFQQEGKLDAAIKRYSVQIKKCANFSEAYLNRGFCLYSKSEVDEAQADFDAALKVSADKPETLVQMGDFYFSIKDYTKAYQTYKSITKINDKYAMAYFKMARAQWKPVVGEFAGKYDADSVKLLKKYRNLLDSVEILFNKAVDLDATDYDFFYFRGDFKLILKRFKDALADFDKAIEIRPYRQKGIQSAGFCWDLLGDKKKACTYFQRWASLIDPENPRAFLSNKEWAEKYCKDAEKGK
jgi:TPR repeat protein/Tfp pilus assembly protein PilF